MEFSNPYERIPPAPTPSFLYADQFVWGGGTALQSFTPTAEGIGLNASRLGPGQRYRIFGFEVMPALGGGSGGQFKIFQTTDDATIRAGTGRALFEFGMGNAVLTPFIAAVPPTGAPLDPGVGLLAQGAVLLGGADVNMSIFINAAAVIE